MHAHGRTEYRHFYRDAMMSFCFYLAMRSSCAAASVRQYVGATGDDAAQT